MAELGTAQGETSSSSPASVSSTSLLSSSAEGQHEGSGQEGGVGHAADVAIDDIEGGIMAISRKVAEAVTIKGLLERNTDEIDNMLRVLNGSYVKPGVGGERVGRTVTMGCGRPSLLRCKPLRISLLASVKGYLAFHAFERPKCFISS